MIFTDAFVFGRQEGDVCYAWLAHTNTNTNLSVALTLYSFYLDELDFVYMDVDLDGPLLTLFSPSLLRSFNPSYGVLLG